MKRESFSFLFYGDYFESISFMRYWIIGISNWYTIIFDIKKIFETFVMRIYAEWNDEDIQEESLPNFYLEKSTIVDLVNEANVFSNV